MKTCDPVNGDRLHCKEILVLIKTIKASTIQAQ